VYLTGELVATLAEFRCRALSSCTDTLHNKFQINLAVSGNGKMQQVLRLAGREGWTAEVTAGQWTEGSSIRRGNRGCFFKAGKLTCRNFPR